MGDISEYGSGYLDEYILNKKLTRINLIVIIKYKYQMNDTGCCWYARLLLHPIAHLTAAGLGHLLRWVPIC